MEAYTGFAGVYDLLMDETPYRQWCENVVHELEKYGICDGLLLDILLGGMNGDRGGAEGPGIGAVSAGHFYHQRTGLRRGEL